MQGSIRKENERLGRSCPEQRRIHILEVAAHVFAIHGYGASSMSMIAMHLGGSKSTLYKYFSSKEELFEAVMEITLMSVVAPLQKIVDAGGDDLEAMLVLFGQRYLSALVEPEALNLVRIIHAECLRFQDVATTFMRSGPEVAQKTLARALARFAEKAQIDCPDPVAAAGLYLGMVRADVHLRASLGLTETPDRFEIDQQVRLAARIFAQGMRRH